VPGEPVLKNAPDQPLNEWRRDLRFGQPDDIPSGQKRLGVFGGVRDETGGAIVASTAVNVQTALDFEKRFAFHMSEIGPPFALRVKDEFTTQLRPAEPAPVESELRFESRAAGFGAEARAYRLGGASNVPPLSFAFHKPAERANPCWFLVSPGSN
jgi:hypothetical protein